MSLFYSLKQPYRYYHQTLTFAQAHSGEDAKKKLDSFLKEFLRKFPKTLVIWFREFQKNNAPHFHVMFLLYKKEWEGEEVLPYPDCQMIPLFGREVFRIWRRLNDPKPYHKANEMRCHELDGKTLNYFLKNVREAKNGKIPSSERWWGVRNTSVLAENKVEVPRSVFLEDFKRRFQRGKPAAKSATERSKKFRQRKKARNSPKRKSSTLRAPREYASIASDWF